MIPISAALTTLRPSCWVVVCLVAGWVGWVSWAVAGLPGCWVQLLYSENTSLHLYTRMSFNSLDRIHYLHLLTFACLEGMTKRPAVTRTAASITCFGNLWCVYMPTVSQTARYMISTATWQCMKSIGWGWGLKNPVRFSLCQMASAKLE